MQLLQLKSHIFLLFQRRLPRRFAPRNDMLVVRQLQQSYTSNYNLHYDTLTDLRMAEIAPFSSRETCA